MMSTKTVILFKNPSGCKPCEVVQLFLEREYPDLPVTVINPADEPELAIKFNVHSVPTLIVVARENNGKVLGRVNGVDFTKTREVIKLS